MVQVALPTQLGRFALLKTLDRDAQGDILLADDLRQKRKVAIKVFNPPKGGITAMRALVDDALSVTQLAHPGIVPLIDADEQDGRPWLAYEYAEGETLAAMLKRAGREKPERALDIAVQLLKALGYAHARDILHLDLRPANVIIGPDGAARIMQFGIASLMKSSLEEVGGFLGAYEYLAPECASGAPYTPKADLFAVGMLLYEMLTGAPAMVGTDAADTRLRVIHEPFPPPSARGAIPDERLDALVLRAIAKDPAARFASAVEMEHAIYRYLSPEAIDIFGETPELSGPMDFLLRRMTHRSDFPALASIISAVNRAAASDTDRVTLLSNAILKDFALTSKILKLINSAHFSQYRGTVSTISRAVVLMGYDTIRQIAVTLMLLEHLRNKAQAAQLKEQVIANYFCALVARELSSKAGLRDPEEALISAMVHPLGRLLSAFYFHEGFQEIEMRVQRGEDEELAAAQVLGVTFEALGMTVARRWHFPEQLIATMQHLPTDQVHKPHTEQQRLRSLAGLAAGIGRILREKDPARQRTQLGVLLTHLGEGLGINEKQLFAAARRAADYLLRDSALPRTGSSPLMHSIMRWLASAGEEESSAPAQQTPPTGAVVVPDALTAHEDANVQALLSAGIQDITNTLIGSFQLNDVLRMVLETMYRAVGFTRVLLCIRDPASNSLRGRFGFGQDIDQIIKRGFTVPLSPSDDIFHAAISQGTDLFVEDMDQVREQIPAWYRNLVPARALLLFPVLVNKRPLGLLYADSDVLGAIRLGSTELNLLKTLRNQAVLAIKQNG